ncbi:MAG TPA: rhodanese-like domain-containing protein [Steroidobacteraceae bacterium]|jgi:rhodanese-related sulfurtransferase|nr:rhodanese-like domain-containing protein [Steroidobacteraceae bacterium]
MDRLLEYAGHHSILAAAAVLMALVALGYEMRARAQTFAAASPQDVIRLMNQNALVLDIRPQEAFAAGHVAGARHMPSDQIVKAGETLKKQKDKPIVVYCESGPLAASAVRELIAQGFTRVCSLRGGLSAWRTDNLPLAKG